MTRRKTRGKIGSLWMGMMDGQGTPVLEYHAPPTGRRRRVPTPGEELCKLALLATLFVGYGVVGDTDRKVYFLLAGVFLWIAIAAMGVVLRIRDAAEYRRARVARWVVLTLWLASVAVFLALPVWYSRTCPHGWRSHNGYVGLAHSSNGGPCEVRRGASGRNAWHLGGGWYVFIPSTSGF